MWEVFEKGFLVGNIFVLVGVSYCYFLSIDDLFEWFFFLLGGVRLFVVA